MHSLETTSHAQEQIHKLIRKNNALAKALRDKIKQILENPKHFKPLGNALHGTRRAHVAGCFALIYEIVEPDTVRLLRFAHHD
ncbi:MAG: type II toxin-antitoxin system mRNA interferase toxin, RelE/StbE family [Candidatus Micrarchaeota archaeon]